MLRNLFVVLLAFIALVSESVAGGLREAAADGNVERVKYLLELGDDANTEYENGFTPIFFASTPKVASLLLSHGAKLNIRTRASSSSPIEHVAEDYFRDKRRGDNWKTTFNFGDLQALLAAEHRKQVVDLLRGTGAEYTADTAIYMNDIKYFEERLANDASWVNTRGGSRSVPLRVAARTGRDEICKLLLEHKADPDSFEEGNGYPIMFEAVNHPAVVKLLIEHRANLKRRITWLGGRTGVWIVGDEATALHYAVSVGNLESVKLLINAGLDSNAADDQGQTPLHLAIRFEHWGNHRSTQAFEKIIGHLLENDASLRFKNNKGITPYQLAKELKSPGPILELLRKKQEESESKRNAIDAR